LIRVLLVGLGQRGAVGDGRRCVGADFVGRDCRSCLLRCRWRTLV